MMPAGGGEKRAEAMSMLAGMYHEMATAPRSPTGSARRARKSSRRHAAGGAARVPARLHQHATCLSSDFVRKQVNARMRSEQLWRELRPTGDWAGVPAGIRGRGRDGARGGAAARRRAGARALRRDDGAVRSRQPRRRYRRRCSPTSRPSSRTSCRRRWRIRRKSSPTRPLKPLNAPFPIEKQKALGLAMMEAHRLRLRAWPARHLAPPVLRRRADRRAHDDALHRRPSSSPR